FLGPKLLALRRLQRGPLQRDEIAIGAQRRLRSRQLTAAAQGQVAFKNFRPDRVQTPAVENRVAFRQRQLKSVIESMMNVQTKQRRARQIEGTMHFALDKCRD